MCLGPEQGPEARFLSLVVGIVFFVEHLYISEDFAKS